jgi:hypothetical protein
LVPIIPIEDFPSNFGNSQEILEEWINHFGYRFYIKIESVYLKGIIRGNNFYISEDGYSISGKTSSMILYEDHSEINHVYKTNYYSGSHVMDVFTAFSDMLGYGYSALIDLSEKVCDDYSMYPVSIYSIITKGRTWYNSYGYLPHVVFGDAANLENLTIDLENLKVDCGRYTDLLNEVYNPVLREKLKRTKDCSEIAKIMKNVMKDYKKVYFQEYFRLHPIFKIDCELGERSSLRDPEKINKHFYAF